MKVMKKFFNSIKWIFVALLIIPTLLLIIGGGVVSGGSQVLTNPDNIKTWLDEGEVYQNIPTVVADEIISRAKAQSDNEDLKSITEGILNEQEANELSKNIFTPEWIQTESEKVIDSSYRFLNGETETITFTINLTEVNKNTKKELTTIFIQRAENLPTCSSDTELSSDQINLLQADCLPSSISSQEIRSQILNGIDSIPFFQENQISSEDLNIEINQKENIQKGFKALKNSTLLILFAVLIFSFAIFLITPKLKNKLKTIGYLWGSGGLLLVAISLLAKTSFSSFVFNIIFNQIPSETRQVMDLIRSPVELAYDDILNSITATGLYIIAFGVIIVILSFITKKK